MVRVTRRLLGGKSAESSWLRFVIDHAPVILFALDPQGRITLSEGRGLETMGLRPGQLVGKSVFDLYAAEPEVLENVRRALAGEDFEALTTLASGQVLSTRFQAIHDARNQPAGTVGVSVDVTPERHALEALRQSEARLRLVTQQLPCITWTTDADLRITGVAGRAASDLDSSLGQRLEEISQFSQCGLDAHRQALAGVPAEYQVERDDRSYEVHVAPFADESGAPAGCIGLAVDVTDRRRAEAATMRLQTEHGLLLNAVPAMVCFRDRAGVIKRCNHAFAAVFGLTPELVESRSLSELLPCDALRELDLDRQVFESGQPRLGIVEPCLLADGTSVWLRMDRMPILDEDDRTVSILVCCVDVTPLKRAEEQLASSLSLLQATLESTADGILVVDREGHIVVHNQRFADLWGLPADMLETHEDSLALRAVLSRVVDPEGFMARVRELYATPEAEGHDVLQLVDGRIIERVSRPQHVGGEIVGRVWSFRDVTARRSAEAERDRLLEVERATRERAQVAERWLTELVHGMDAIVWERRAGSLGFSFVSDGGEVILGYPLTDWLEPGFWASVVHPADLPLVLARTEDPNDRSVELRVRAADGSWVWLQNNIRVVRDEAGVVTHHRGVMIDITARKRAEEALLSSERQLRALVDNTPYVGIQRYAIDGRVLEWNPASEQLFGMRAADVLGRTLDEVGVLQPKSAAELVATIADIAATGRPHGPTQWTVRRGDGSTGVVLSTIFGVPGPAGEEFICMDVDVTRRRRAEEALERHAARLEVLARVSRRLDVAAADVAAIVRALALGIHQELGDTTFVLVPGEDAEVTHGEPSGPASDALEVIARDPTMRGRSALLNGESHPAVVGGMFLSACAVPLAVHGRVLGVLCVGRDEGQPHGPEALRLFEDLGERAALGIENARHFHAARQAIRQRDEFLSVASHELRTPLQSLGLVVQGLSAAAARGGGLGAVPPDVIARGLGAVVRQEQRLARLVDALLDVTRLSSGQLHLEVEPVDLPEVVREVVDLFKGELAAAHCDLRVDQPTEPIVGRWDRSRLEQVVANLLSNAVKYGAGKPIDLTVSSQDGLAQLHVRDRGIGMTAETCDQIFQRFKRGVSARHYGGLGLGLFITRQIVEALGGSVRVESVPGEGSTFSVTLPLAGPRKEAGA